MAMMKATEIPPSAPGGLPGKAMSMAYSMPNQTTAFNTPTTYRISRGFPKLRRGVPVAPIPEFKSLTVYTQTQPSGNAKNPPSVHAPTAFQNTKATTTAPTYTWPVPA